MAKSTIKFKVTREGDFDFDKQSNETILQTRVGMRQMLEDIHRVSRPKTPLKEGDLRGDVAKRVYKVANSIRGSIEWKRPYAWYQERGYTNGPVRRYTTPGTKAHFAEESVVEVTLSSKRYFGK